MKNFSVQGIYGWYRNLIRNPKYRWWAIAGSLIYILSPFDIAPEVFPVVGLIDDGVIATLLVAEVSQLMLSSLKSGRKKPGTSEADPIANDAEVKQDNNPL